MATIVICYAMIAMIVFIYSVFASIAREAFFPGKIAASTVVAVAWPALLIWWAVWGARTKWED